MLSFHDQLNIAIIWAIDILAILANLLLVTAIILRTPNVLRTYSVFLLNNAIIDFVSATASALGTVRTMQYHEGSATIYVFVGPCTLISEELCRICQSLHINLVQHSTIILLFSFGYRLYILGGDLLSSRSLRPFHIWIVCPLSLAFVSIPIAAYYLEQTSVTPQIISQLHIEGYVTSNYAIFGSTRALMIGISYCTVSPLVMTLIFFVRRKLISRIELAKPTEKQLHLSIARALTYQLLLPCGVAIAAVIWLCDLMQIWSSEASERIIMIMCSFFSLASPIINFTMLPPYRAMLSHFRPKKANVDAISNSTHYL